MASNNYPRSPRSPVFTNRHERDRSSEPRGPNRADLMSRGSNPSSPMVDDIVPAGKVCEAKGSREHFCSDIIDGKLTDKDVESGLKALAAIFGEKLRQVVDPQDQVSDQRLDKRSRAAVKNTVVFHAFLEQMMSNAKLNSMGNILPMWLQLVLDRSGSSSNTSLVGKIWRLLVWSLHHDGGNRKDSTTQEEVDAWYATFMSKEKRNLENPNKALTDLYANMCSDFGVVNDQESDGLARSIMVAPEDDSSDVASSESSLSSQIPVEDLWKFRSIMQGVVEKCEDISKENTRLRSLVDQRGVDVDELENDMYLPQREALETYDLGNLMLTMNSVIQRLSEEVVSMDPHRLCQSCRRAVGDAIKGHMSEESQSQYRNATATHGGSSPSGSRFTPPSGLRSRESGAQVPIHRRTYNGNGFLPVPVLPPTTVGAIPKLAARPSPGTFQGIGGPVPRNQLTVLQNSQAHTRAYSSSDAFHLRQKEMLNDVSNSKSSSLDSVFSPGKTQGRSREEESNQIEGGVGRNQHERRIQSVSDSDEEYEVRGPPDTPPEVRAIESRQNNRADFLDHETVARVRGHQKSRSSDSGVETPSPVYMSGEQSPRGILGGSTPRNVLDLKYSQVQQCTGDNRRNRQDMLLPSSVEWSTVQLKDGGIPSPTLEAMNQFSASMRHAEKSVQDRQCNVCQLKFSNSESPSTIYDHIQNHFHRNSRESSLLASPQRDCVVDGVGDVRISPNDLVQVPANRQCPVCEVQFPAYVPTEAMQSHINLHFDENPDGFEVVGEDFNYMKQ